MVMFVFHLYKTNLVSVLGLGLVSRYRLVSGIAESKGLFPRGLCFSSNANRGSIDAAISLFLCFLVSHFL